MAVLVLRKAVNTNVSVVKKSKNAARTEEKPENGDEKGAEIKPKSIVLQTSSVAPVANKALLSTKPLAPTKLPSPKQSPYWHPYYAASGTLARSATQPR